MARSIYSFDQDRTILISFAGSEENTRTLRVSFTSEATVVIPIGQSTNSFITIAPLSFETTDEAGRKTVARAKITIMLLLSTQILGR